MAEADNKEQSSNQDNLTPEERLLKIIENPDIQKRKLPNLKIEQATVVLDRAKKLLGTLKKFRLNKINKDSLKHLDLRVATIIFAVICGAFSIYWVFDFVKSRVTLDKRFQKIIAESAIAETGSNVDQGLMNLDTSKLAEETKNRNIFSFSPPAAEAGMIMTQTTFMVTNLKLVGILWSDNPQAMIEDTKEQKTYFVSSGDKVGEVTVKKIFRDKVIIGKDSQEWELR